MRTFMLYRIRPTQALWAGLLLLAFAACKSDPAPKGGGTNTPDGKMTDIPRFDKDSAYAYVQRQVDFGPRVPASAAHAACAEWLAGELRRHGAKVTEQRFTAKDYKGNTLAGVNIMGAFNPEKSVRVVLAAHWDSRYVADQDDERTNEPILGADDGGSGVGVLLEIARQLSLQNLDLGVDIVFYDLEDQGQNGGGDESINTWCLGSQYWSRNLPGGYRPKFGILLDMVGAKNARFPKEGTSMTYAPQTMDKVWKIAHDSGFGSYFDNAYGRAAIDDHYFVNQIAGFPMIDIIHLPLGTEAMFADYWHTHDDDMDIISANTLRAVGQTVLNVLYYEAAGQF